MHIKALDGLRGLAAYTVVISHFTNETGLFGGLLGFGAGQVGVMLFFALSGYLMGALYLGTPISLTGVRTFARNRAARVVPLYFAVVLASLVATVAGASILYDVTPQNAWSHLLFVSGTGVLWTVPVEVQFYALFPVLWFARTRSPLPFWAVTLVAGVASWPFEWLPILHVLPFFLAGTALSQLRLRPFRGADAAFIGAIVLFAVSFPRVRAALDQGVGDIWRSPEYLLLIPGLLAFAVVSPLADRLLGSRLLAFAGRISYSVYLLHMPVLLALKATPLAGNMGAFFLAFVVLTTLIAAISQATIEAPVRRLLRAARLAVSMPDPLGLPKETHPTTGARRE